MWISIYICKRYLVIELTWPYSSFLFVYILITFSLSNSSAARFILVSPTTFDTFFRLPTISHLETSTTGSWFKISSTIYVELKWILLYTFIHPPNVRKGKWLTLSPSNSTSYDWHKILSSTQHGVKKRNFYFFSNVQ